MRAVPLPFSGTGFLFIASVLLLHYRISEILPFSCSRWKMGEGVKDPAVASLLQRGSLCELTSF